MDVVLRAFRVSDDARLQELRDDPDVRRWNPMAGSDAAAWREGLAGDGESAVTWAVAAVDDDRLVGVVSVFAIDRTHGTGQVGYRVVAAERRQGVATSALRLAADHAFAELGLRRVELFHALANPGSCGVATRARFVQEGTLRASYVYGDGEAYDEHLHARLAADGHPGGQA